MKSLLDRLTTQNFDPRITRRNLSYFYAAAKLGNFTQASKVCSVSQPSLSRGIILLEEALKIPLFDRAERKVILTRQGRELLPQIELYLNQYLDFAAALEAQKTGTSSKIKIASISSLTADLLPSLINKFERSNSNTNISLLDGINSEIINAVEVGEVDFGIISTLEDPEKFKSVELFRDQYCVTVEKQHSFYNQKDVRWGDLKQEEIATFEKGSNTYDCITNVFDSIGIFFKPVACVKYRYTLMGLVRHRGLITILPKLVAQEEKQGALRAIPLVAPIRHRIYYLIRLKDRENRKDVLALETFLRFELMGLEKT